MAQATGNGRAGRSSRPAARPQNDDDDEEDMPEVAGAGGSAPDDEEEGGTPDDASSTPDDEYEDDGDNGGSGRSVSKGVNIRARDLVKAMAEVTSAAVIEALEPFQEELAGIREENRKLRTQVVQLTKAVNLSTETVGEIGESNRALVKGLGTLSELPELVKGIQLNLDAADGSAARSLPQDEARTAGIQPGDELEKGGVARPDFGTNNPGSPSRKGTCNEHGGDLTDEEITEEPRLLSKAMQLVDGGEKVAGFTQLMTEHARGVVKSATLAKVRDDLKAKRAIS